MARVTAAEVKKVFVTAQDVDSFIDTATLLIDEELATSGLSTGRLKQIELYLAAHFATTALNHGGVTKRKVDDSEDEYRGVSMTATGLMGSPFGQQAVALDTSGTLGALSKSIVKAEFRVL